jgi:DNA repair protein RecN (Recombination protein N)
LLEKRAEGARIRDLLVYQIKEIDSMSLHEGEEEELVDKKLKIKNSEKLHKHADFVYKALRGSEKGSVAVLIDRSISSLRQISDVVPECAEYAESMREMLYRIEEIAEDVAAITDNINEDPTEALNVIESRLDKISKLKRKYGLTISSILEFRDKCARDLELIDNSEDAERRIRKELGERYHRAHELAVKLHERRIKSSAELEKKVKNTLDFLDMPSVVFYASYRELFVDGQHKLTPTGFETAEFYISANKGSEAMPMSKIASGGELARIMLALKSALADKDGVGTIIYDEIDAGVSGKTARKIGVKMLELSKTAQLICVTHSAQIASLADTHMLIKKRELDGNVRTELFALDYDGRVGEVSRILGGIDVTESQRRAAIDMIKEKSELS